MQCNSVKCVPYLTLPVFIQGNPPLAFILLSASSSFSFVEEKEKEGIALYETEQREGKKALIFFYIVLKKNHLLVAHFPDSYHPFISFLPSGGSLLGRVVCISCPTFSPKCTAVRFHCHHVTVPVGLAAAAKRPSQLLIKQNQDFLP